MSETPLAAALAALVAGGGSAEWRQALDCGVAGAPGSAAALYAPGGSGGALRRVATAGGEGPQRAATELSGTTTAVLCSLLSQPGPPIAPGDATIPAAEWSRAGLTGAHLWRLRAGKRAAGVLAWWPGPDEVVPEWVAPLADALALSVSRERLVSGVRERAAALDGQLRRAEALAETAAALAAADSSDAVVVAAAGEARALVDADLALVALREPPGPLRIAAGAGWSAGDPLPAVLELADDDLTPVVWLGREARATIIAGEGGVPLGALVAVRRGGAPFGEDELARLGALARQTAGALALARLLERLRREEQERRSLGGALLTAQEDERRRLAEDIHDGPVQNLAGVGLLLDALGLELAASNPAAVAQVERAAAAAREAMRGLRRAIFDLHPMSLEELGFAAAVGTLLDRLELQGVKTTLQVDAAANLPPNLRTVAFRTCREAIANILRHADAHRVRVEAAREPSGEIVITIEDDGRGFDPSTIGSGIGEGHLGLAATRERARAFSADLQVISQAGRGTTVRLQLPAPARGSGA